MLRHTSRPVTLTVISAALITASSLIATPLAHADNLDLTGSLVAGASSREGDGVAHGTLRGHWGFHPNLGVALTLYGGAATDDERSIGAFALAGQLETVRGRWRPAVRVGFIHSHETAREDFEEDPFTVTLGVSESIRHRTGALAELGTTLDVWAVGPGNAFASADVATHVMFDGSGPRAYVLVGFGVGYRL